MALLAQREIAERPASLAARGRALEGGEGGELTYLAAFLDSLDGGARDSYLAAAPEAAARVSFTGRLEHSDLPDLLPACEAQVVPSTFPEAFGMVAAEAAAGAMVCDGLLTPYQAQRLLRGETRGRTHALPRVWPPAQPIDGIDLNRTALS